MTPDELDARKEALIEALAIVRDIYDITPGNATDVYIATVDALQRRIWPDPEEEEAVAR